MTVSLADVQSGTRAAPPRILVYGIEGVGKSTFASKFPNPIFIQTEDGLDNIDCAKFPVARKFEDVIGALDALIREKHEYSTVVIDSLDWLEALIWKMLCDRDGAESIEQVGGGYAKGYVQALTHWRRVIEKLQTLRLDKGCAIVLMRTRKSSCTTTRKRRNFNGSRRSCTARLIRFSRSGSTSFCSRRARSERREARAGAAAAFCARSERRNSRRNGGMKSPTNCRWTRTSCCARSAIIKRD